MRPNLIDEFFRYFELVSVVTDEQKREVFKLRYQVYCVETGFENEENCQLEYDEQGNKLRLEIDEFDDRSAHYLIKHKKSDLYAATVRLVLPDHTNYAASFPIESHCTIENSVTDPEIRKHVAEISRFAVSKTFKRRPGEAGTIAGVTKQTVVNFESNERRVLPHITISLFAGIVQMTRAHGITHWYAVMEPALLRLLARFGIHFPAIGNDIDYHGIRRPCLAIVDDVLPSIKKTARPVWDFITDNGNLA